MTTIYIVIVNQKVSQVAYSSLEEAQEFVKNRCKPEDLKNQNPYYHLFSNRDYNWYTIQDLTVRD